MRWQLHWPLAINAMCISWHFNLCSWPDFPGDSRRGTRWEADEIWDHSPSPQVELVPPDGIDDALGIWEWSGFFLGQMFRSLNHSVVYPEWWSCCRMWGWVGIQSYLDTFHFGEMFGIIHDHHAITYFHVNRRVPKYYAARWCLAWIHEARPFVATTLRQA